VSVRECERERDRERVCARVWERERKCDRDRRGSKQPNTFWLPGKVSSGWFRRLVPEVVPEVGSGGYQVAVDGADSADQVVLLLLVRRDHRHLRVEG